MNPKPAPAIALLASLLLPACASITREEPPEVTVSFNDQAPEREKKTYTIMCDTGLVRQWFMSAPQALIALGEALEKRGYVEADAGAAATHVIKVNLGFGPRQQRSRLEDENPDSIRYQNVAAMAGGGRYSQLLTERGNDAAGSIIMGPTGEIIPTGAWKQILDQANRADKATTSDRFDVLLLSAWATGTPPAGPEVFAWQIVVKAPVNYEMPGPKRVGLLLDQAAAKLNNDWPAAGAPAAVPASTPASEPAKQP